MSVYPERSIPADNMKCARLLLAHCGQWSLNEYACSLVVPFWAVSRSMNGKFRAKASALERQGLAVFYRPNSTSTDARETKFGNFFANSATIFLKNGPSNSIGIYRWQIGKIEWRVKIEQPVTFLSLWRSIAPPLTRDRAIGKTLGKGNGSDQNARSRQAMFGRLGNT